MTMFKEFQEIGPYILIKELGKGGFGEVWLAEKRSQFVTKRVAVKLPHEDQVDLEAIKQEATLWEQASGHPNVLPIIDADIYEEQVVIVSEYAEGGSLADMLKEKGNLSIEQTVEIIIGVLKGLNFLHLKQIIHRDIKPQNVLMQGNTPRLADFGISRVMTASNISSVVVGTDAYMSPEAFDGKRNVQTDIWSVGVMLYELLTGEKPFPQEHPTERMFAVLTKDFEPLPENIPPELRQIVKKALSKKPEDRFQTAYEMQTRLYEILMLFRNPTFAPTEILDSEITKEVESKTETKTVQAKSPEQTTGIKNHKTDELPETAPDYFLPKTEPAYAQESIVTQAKEFQQSNLTSSTIPPTEIQINNTASDKSEKSKSLYLYLAGIFVGLFIIAIIGSGGLFLYFSNDFGSKKPVNITNTSDGAEEDGSDQEKLVVIKISGDKLLLNDTEISENEIVDKFKKRMSDKPSSEKIIYVSANDEIIYKKVIEVLEFGRKSNISNFGLMLSNEKIADSVKVKFPSSSSGKNNLDFPISNAFQEVAEQPKLKPLLLQITIKDNGDLNLNNTSISSESLGSNLRNIFRAREDNLVFKEGTNEIEKTVHIEASPSINYGKVLEIIRTVEKAKASPIILYNE